MVESAPIGNVYAWGRTARLLSEESIQHLMQIKGSFNMLDICSAYPLFAQITRERIRENNFNTAHTIAGKLIEYLQNPYKFDRINNQQLIPSFHTLENTEREQLKRTLSPKKNTPRRMLTASILDILQSPPIDDTTGNTDTAQTVAFHLKNLLTQNQHVYRRKFELEERGPKQGRWEIIVPDDTDNTLYAVVEQIVGSDRVDSLLHEISMFLADHTIPHIHPTMVATLDFASKGKIEEEAKSSFPDDYRRTEFFRRAGEFDYHIQADVQHLPLAPNSISLITSFEGWPYYFATKSTEENQIIADMLYRSLKPDGRAVFFPWTLEPDQNDSSVLTDIEQHWKDQGAHIEKQEVSAEQLRSEMRPREAALSQHSPIFQDNDVLTVLVVEKPSP